MNNILFLAIFLSIFTHGLLFANIINIPNSKVAENNGIIEVSIAKKGSKTQKNIIADEKDTVFKEKKKVSKKEIKKAEIPIKKVTKKIEAKNNEKNKNIDTNNHSTLNTKEEKEKAISAIGNDLLGKDKDNLLAIAHKVPKPKYPLKSRQKGEEGTVTIEFIVTEKGKGKNPKIVASSGYPSLDKEALAVIAKSEFIPAKINGIVSSSTMRLRFKFSLQDY